MHIMYAIMEFSSTNNILKITIIILLVLSLALLMHRKIKTVLKSRDCILSR